MRLETEEDICFSDKVIARFFKNVYPEPNTGCWLWGGRVWGEYGLFWVNYAALGAHRVSVAIHFKTTLEREDIICHKCNNPYCVNPDHLYIGTYGINHEQAVIDGRMAMKGMKPARKIRQLSLDGEEIAIFNSIQEATKKYGFCNCSISLVCSGKRKSAHKYKWEYVKDITES